MTIDVFPLAPSELESELFVKEEVNPEGIDAEELEFEVPTIEPAEVENQDALEDPIRLRVKKSLLQNHKYGIHCTICLYYILKGNDTEKVLDSTLHGLPIKRKIFNTSAR